MVHTLEIVPQPDTLSRPKQNRTSKKKKIPNILKLTDLKSSSLTQIPATSFEYAITIACALPQRPRLGLKPRVLTMLGWPLPGR